jgi:hypothetical protein
MGGLDTESEAIILERLGTDDFCLLPMHDEIQMRRLAVRGYQLPAG